MDRLSQNENKNRLMDELVDFSGVETPDPRMVWCTTVVID
jgi:hypothetical protein